MKITPINTTCIRIEEAHGLDPINVVMRDIRPGVGEIVITCYGLSWTAYWGAMPEPTVREFVSQASPDYVVNRLWITDQGRTKARWSYLTRIVVVVQAALMQEWK